VSPTRIAISPHHGPQGREGRAERRVGLRPAGGAGDRDHLLDRLRHLRGILPVFAREPASARRRTAALRVENRGLLEEVRRLRRQRGEGSPPAVGS
jgi:hypothetical protein